MTTRLIRGACPHDCPDTCGIITEVQDEQAVDFYADDDHPVTQGWLCAKVQPYLDHVYHPDRLKYPLRRAGAKGEGRWQRISWAEALAEIAERWRSIIEQYGAAAILPYSYSGTLGLVQMTVASARLWNRLGASQLDRAICGAAAEYVVKATLGARRSPAYTEIAAHSRLIIIWGHNPVTTAPHLMPHLKAAQKRGAMLIVIDPRRTRTAKWADIHLAPLPGTDGALALGLAHVIVMEGLHNEDWLNEHTVGWSKFCPLLDEYSPYRVSQITGLSEADIIELARLYAFVSPALIKIADGLQRNLNGGQNVRAICTLPALTGQYGVPGGGLAYSTSGYLKWNKEAINHWTESPPPARTVNMNQLGAALLGEVSDPPIKSLFVFGANPAAISPNSARIVEGLKQEDLFTVVHELFMTDTADYADIVLPATSQLEQTDLHKAYGHTYLTYNQQAIPPVGESKSNWELMTLLAEALGFEESWLHQTADDVIEEILTATDSPLLKEITLERLKEEGTIPLALPSSTPFADLNFPTPSGKVELYSQQMAEDDFSPLPVWRGYEDDGDPPLETTSSPPLDLISAASHHFVSSTFANQDSLLRREGDPFVEIHPQDAAERDIQTGDIVIVENERGWCKLKAIVTDSVRPGVLASPKGRWPKRDPFREGEEGRNINWTTSDALADVAGQGTFHSNKVWIRKWN